MIKIHRDYKAAAFFNSSGDTTWDKYRRKAYRVSLFGMTVFQRTENLDIEYGDMKNKGVGFKKEE